MQRGGYQQKFSAECVKSLHMLSTGSGQRIAMLNNIFIDLPTMSPLGRVAAELQ